MRTALLLARVVGDRHVGASERPGEVDDGGCHVETERLTVVLSRP